MKGVWGTEIRVRGSGWSANVARRERGNGWRANVRKRWSSK